MADDKDVLDKVDALLKRHNVSPPGSPSDTGGVPVLTELVDAGNAAVEVEPTPVTEPLPPELVAEVMIGVEAHLAAELERRLAQRLSAQAREAVQEAMGELRGELARMVVDTVAEALSRRSK